MAKRIDKKIMAFVGTEDASKLVHVLSDYTDDIYACVASEYGKATHPGGNITLLSKYQDEDSIRRWIDRGVELIIDGTAVTADEHRAVIGKVCQETGVEYLRLAANHEFNLNTSLGASPEELKRTVEYAVGKVLVKGDTEMYRIISQAKDFQTKAMPMAANDPEILKELLDMGYPAENILGTDRIYSPEFLTALFKELDITHFIMLGSDKRGFSERIEAINRSMVKATVYGELPSESGLNLQDMWEMLAKRFDIDEYWLQELI